METKNKVIIGSAILVVFVVLAFTGIVSTTSKEVFIKDCKQTKLDGGSFCEKGTIVGTQSDGITYQKTDYCSLENPDILKEYSCAIGTSGWTAKTIYCDLGCSNGACIPKEGKCVEDSQIII